MSKGNHSGVIKGCIGLDEKDLRACMRAVKTHNQIVESVGSHKQMEVIMFKVRVKDENGIVMGDIDLNDFGKSELKVRK